MSSKKSVIAAGLALFSMFFGAGDLIWPLILGGNSGDMNLWTLIGFVVTAVTLPLLGLCAMMLFMGDYHAFFGRMGRIPAIIVIFLVQAILGPVGSIPRLFTLSHATLAPFLPAEMSLFMFSILASAVVLLFAIKKQRIVDILGTILTPILLVAITTIIVVGFIGHPSAPSSAMDVQSALTYGLTKGYNTLDLIASFIFAPLVLTYFCAEENSTDCPIARRRVIKKMFQASLFAAGLLGTMYFFLTYLASYYVPYLPSDTPNEGRLAAISMYLLGTKGSLFSSIAVAMACLTTAIPLTTIAADYIRKDLFKEKIGIFFPLILTLFISGSLANLGFMGIANMLEPILKIMCPALIVLSIMNICEKIYQVPVRKGPVLATFGVSTLLHII